MSFNFELYLENDNSQSLCSFIYQLARVLKWSVLVSVTSLISIAILSSVKPVAGKKAGKNKLVQSSASDLQTSNTIYSVGAKAWDSKNERIFQRNNFFSLSFALVSCLLFLNFARREFYVFPMCPVVRTAVSANPRLNFSPGFFFFYQKRSLRIIFSIFFRVSNHQIVAKES